MALPLLDAALRESRSDASVGSSNIYGIDKRLVFAAAVGSLKAGGFSVTAETLNWFEERLRLSELSRDTRVEPEIGPSLVRNLNDIPALAKAFAAASELVGRSDQQRDLAFLHSLGSTAADAARAKVFSMIGAAYGRKDWEGARMMLDQLGSTGLREEFIDMSGTPEYNRNATAFISTHLSPNVGSGGPNPTRMPRR